MTDNVDGGGEADRSHDPLPRRELALPRELASALDDEPTARSKFQDLPPSHRREYVQWVAEARRHDTRERRAAQTVMRLLERS